MPVNFVPVYVYEGQDAPIDYNGIALSINTVINIEMNVKLLLNVNNYDNNNWK